MARIFYRTATGDIYGVHAGAFTGTLPTGVDFIDVAEAPDQIAWPVNASGKSGEEFARVQGGVLVAFDPDFSAIDQATIDRMLLESGVMRAFALMMFEIGKAGKTGNWAFFDDVTDKATFKTLLMSMIRSPRNQTAGCSS